jgi:hypothetical protein
MVKKRRPKLKSLALQAEALKGDFPDFSVRINRSNLIWEAFLIPSPLSETYRVRITYKLNKSPRIKVIDPPLQKREGKKPPHLYKGDFLCCYLPRSGEWDGQMFLARTIVPWACEWLLHYEIWLVTGEWRGGGIHPRGRKKAA